MCIFCLNQLSVFGILICVIGITVPIGVAQMPPHFPPRPQPSPQSRPPQQVQIVQLTAPNRYPYYHHHRHHNRHHHYGDHRHIYFG